MTLSKYQSVTDSISLACLSDKTFSIKEIEDSEYDGKPSVKITTTESFKGKDLTLTEKKRMNMTDDDIDEFRKGEYNKFHTSRTAIVNQLKSPKLREDLTKGPVGPFKSEYIAKPKRGGNPYWELSDA